MIHLGDLLGTLLAADLEVEVEGQGAADQERAHVLRVDGNLTAVRALALTQREAPEDGGTGDEQLGLRHFDAWALAQPAPKLVVAHQLRELGEWFLVGGEGWVEPAGWVVGFGVWVGDWVAGDGEFDGVHDCAFGDEVALVDVVFLEETRDTLGLVSF